VTALLVDAPSVGVRFRHRAHLSDVTVVYTPGGALDRTSHLVMFSPTPVEAARDMLRTLGIVATAVRAFTGPGGVTELRLWRLGRSGAPLASIVGLSPDQLNQALQQA
jgi:hypothetical protein